LRRQLRHRRFVGIAAREQARLLGEDALARDLRFQLRQRGLLAAACSLG
jgi:hypothetical protein